MMCQEWQLLQETATGELALISVPQVPCRGIVTQIHSWGGEDTGTRLSRGGGHT